MVTIKQRGLGKGLSALISASASPMQTKGGEVSVASNATPTGQNELALGRLLPGKYQPRTRFSEDTLQELAQSIRRNGLMQPIIVRSSRDVPDRYEIIAGERRWRAAKIAGLDQVPVIIREINDQQALELALVENIQRQDLGPLEEAAGFQRLIDEFGYTQEELAGIVSKSRTHITNMLRLLGLPDEVREMMERGDLTMGHARALINVPNPLEAAQDIIRRGLSVRQAEGLARERQGVEKQSRPRTSTPAARAPRTPAADKDPDIVALEESLSQNLGVGVAINSRGQGGEIVLSYDSLTQLDEILRRLGG